MTATAVGHGHHWDQCLETWPFVPDGSMKPLVRDLVSLLSSSRTPLPRPRNPAPPSCSPCKPPGGGLPCCTGAPRRPNPFPQVAGPPCKRRRRRPQVQRHAPPPSLILPPPSEFISLCPCLEQEHQPAPPSSEKGSRRPDPRLPASAPSPECSSQSCRRRLLHRHG